MLCLRPPLPYPRWQKWDLQSSDQSWRRTSGSPQLCRRHSSRSDREKTLLPRPAGQPGPFLRHAGLRLPLRLLPELDQQPGPAGPGQRGLRRQARGHQRPGVGSPGGAAPMPNHDLHLQRTAHYQRMGGGNIPGSPPKKSFDLLCFQRQRHQGSFGIYPALGGPL